MGIPPAASICIISEVPERGSPETIVITRFLGLDSLALILQRHFCAVNGLPVAGLENVDRTTVHVDRSFFSTAGSVLLGLVGKQVGPAGERERSEVGQTVAFQAAGFPGSLLVGELLVAGHRSVLTPENSVLRHVLAEVGLVFRLPGFEKAGFGADQFLLHVGRNAVSNIGSSTVLARCLGAGWAEQKREREKNGRASQEGLLRAKRLMVHRAPISGDRSAATRTDLAYDIPSFGLIF